MIDTIRQICDALMTSTTATAAVQRFGMHIVDEQMSIRFTPRDRSFVSGVAVRKWHREVLGSMQLDVDPATQLTYGAMREAFGKFDPTERIHPGDPYELVAYWPRDAQIACSIIIRVDSRSEHPKDRAVVQRVSVVR